MPNRSLKLVHVVTAALVMLLVLVLYFPGLNGALYYDDYNALDKLGQLRTFEDAKAFVLGGTAGPLGRPIALVTYLPHAPNWPHSSRSILAVNIGIHTLNAFLIGLCAFLILRLRKNHLHSAYWLAVGSATLWAVLPLIASSSLIAIQRMTTLASSFMLLGLAGFLVGYFYRPTKPMSAFSIQFGALFIGTTLGIFTKETAALTPVYALILDQTLLRDNRFSSAALRTTTKALLWLSLIIILWHLSPIRINWWEVYENRGWTPYERLQYQVVALWEYLRLAIAPLPTAFSPFHDWRDLNDISFTHVAMASVAWLLTFGFGLWLHLKGNNPWLLFGLLWFLCGHLLESTTLNLELVFEHRNYLAVFGPVFVLTIAAANAPGQLNRIAPIAFVALIIIQGASLYALTSLWGDRALAAERWAERYPRSARAALHATFTELGKFEDRISGLNREIIEIERRKYALTILDRTSKVCPDCSNVQAQALILACTVESTASVRQRAEKLEHQMQQTGDIGISLADGMFTLQHLVSSDDCAPIENEDMIRILSKTLTRSTSINKNVRAKLGFILAKSQTETGDWEGAWATLNKAEQDVPTALPVLQFQIYVAENKGWRDQAIDAVERRRQFEREGTSMSDATLDNLLRSLNQRNWPQKQLMTY